MLCLSSDFQKLIFPNRLIIELSHTDVGHGGCKPEVLFFTRFRYGAALSETHPLE